MAVALTKYNGGPFYGRIKRLGIATQGRLRETLTQSTFVEALLRYITPDARPDRDLVLRGKKLHHADQETLEKLPLRNLLLMTRTSRSRCCWKITLSQCAIGGRWSGILEYEDVCLTRRMALGRLCEYLGQSICSLLNQERLCLWKNSTRFLTGVD